eukprot:6181568-Amphidinium_carterae.1
MSSYVLLELMGPIVAVRIASWQRGMNGVTAALLALAMPSETVKSRSAIARVATSLEGREVRIQCTLVLGKATVCQESQGA